MKINTFYRTLSLTSKLYKYDNGCHLTKASIQKRVNWFLEYLRTLFQLQDLHSVHSHDKLERMWKETAMAYFKDTVSAFD
jgi:hypothetical protein